jgi:DNA repair photolyase
MSSFKIESGLSLTGINQDIISLNPYKGCDFDCLYCDQCHKVKGPCLPTSRDVINSLKKGLKGLLKSKTGQAFKENKWLYIGSQSEVLGPTEEKLELTLQILEILKEYNYHYSIITKNDLIATSSYLKLLNSNSEVQISVSTPMDYCSRIMEKGAPVTHQRLKVARLLSDHNVRVIGRIEPIFPDRPDYFYSLGRRPLDIDQFVYFNNTLVRMLWAHGIKELYMGMLKPRWPMFSNIQRAFGFDLTGFYRENGSIGPYMSPDERKHYYDQIKGLAGSFKMYTAIIDPDMQERKYG